MTIESFVLPYVGKILSLPETRYVLFEKYSSDKKLAVLSFLRDKMDGSLVFHDKDNDYFYFKKDGVMQVPIFYTGERFNLWMYNCFSGENGFYIKTAINDLLKQHGLTYLLDNTALFKDYTED